MEWTMDDLRRGSQRSHKSLFSPWLLIICIRQGIWAFQKAPCLTRQICASTCENPALDAQFQNEFCHSFMPFSPDIRLSSLWVCCSESTL